MPIPSQQPIPSNSSLSGSAASLINTTARWLGVDDDLALGCECADPSLQIERWGQEIAADGAPSS